MKLKQYLYAIVAFLLFAALVYAVSGDDESVEPDIQLEALSLPADAILHSNADGTAEHGITYTVSYYESEHGGGDIFTVIDILFPDDMKFYQADILRVDVNDFLHYFDPVEGRILKQTDGEWLVVAEAHMQGPRGVHSIQSNVLDIKNDKRPTRLTISFPAGINESSSESEPVIHLTYTRDTSIRLDSGNGLTAVIIGVVLSVFILVMFRQGRRRAHTR